MKLVPADGNFELQQAFRNSYVRKIVEIFVRHEEILILVADLLQTHLNREQSGLKEKKDSQGTHTLGSGSFQAVSANNPGFIHVVGMHLQRDNGQQFIPLGVNAPWFQYGKKNGNGHQWGDGTYSVDVMYQTFVASGLNFFHLWTCSWNMGSDTPFARPNIGCDGKPTDTPQMGQSDSWMMDYMVAKAHIKDIYIMPILKHHDQQVFDEADKIKSRYFVARWGYSTNILAWDFNKPLFIGETGLTPCTAHSTGKSSYYQNDGNGLILKGEIWGSLMAGLGVYSPWFFDIDFNHGTSQLVSFKAAKAYAAALPSVPDSATTFSTYQDSSQATTSNTQLRVLGRKNATFAMLYVQNASGTWGAVVRDGKTPVSVSGTVTLKEMQMGSTFTVRWFNTDSGVVVKTDSVTARSNGLVLVLPQSISQSIAAIVTTGGA